MKQRPILFSAPMVRAILDGTKAQTRRVLKVQPPSNEYKLATCIDTTGNKKNEGKHHWITLINGYSIGDSKQPYFSCPYGQVGDELWVRETFSYDDESGKYLYRADNNAETENWDLNKYESGHPKFNWKPSIFMPHKASRILLKITDIRVERLNDISRGACMAEGCPFPNIAKETDPKKWYMDLWESINGTGSRDVNPWVWVITFRRLK